MCTGSLPTNYEERGGREVNDLNIFRIGRHQSRARRVQAYVIAQGLRIILGAFTQAFRLGFFLRLPFRIQKQYYENENKKKNT